jgi:hypothetical protein
VTLVVFPFPLQNANDVHKMSNLVASAKMAYPEIPTRSRARTGRVWLGRRGTTTGWCGRCYEYILPEGKRAEIRRIRNEPSRGAYTDALWYYMVDFDLDGLVDVGLDDADRRAQSAASCPRRERDPVLPSQHKAW